MEFLNKIELCGIVGSSNITTIGNKKQVRFSLAVEHVYKSEGNIVIDTTWFNCTAWEGNKIKDLDKVVKGKIVTLTGRVKMQRMITSTGDERSIWEVICNTLKVDEPDGKLCPE